MPSSSLFDNGRIRKRKVRRKEGTLPFEQIFFYQNNLWDSLFSNNLPSFGICLANVYHRLKQFYFIFLHQR